MGRALEAALPFDQQTMKGPYIMSPKKIALTMALAVIASSMPLSAIRASNQDGGKPVVEVRSDVRFSGNPAPKGPVYPKTVKRNARIGLTWIAGLATLRVSLATGCLPTTARNLRDSFSFKLDRAAKSLSIEGDYWYTQRSKIATRDCMNSAMQAYDFTGIDRGVYRIMRNGRLFRNVDLGGKDMHIGSRQTMKPVFPTRLNPSKPLSSDTFFLHSTTQNPVQRLFMGRI